MGGKGSLKYDGLVDLIFSSYVAREMLIKLYQKGKLKTIREFSKNNSFTYSYVVEMNHILKREGLISVRRHGRSREIFLTNRGIQITKALIDFKGVIEEWQLKRKLIEVKE